MVVWERMKGDYMRVIESKVLSKPDPVSPGDKEAIDHLINWCQDKLTTWESDFLDSIQDHSYLTKRQKEVLDNIWEDVVVMKRRDE